MTILPADKGFNSNPRIARVQCDNPNCAKVFFRPHRDRKWQPRDYCDRTCSGAARKGKPLKQVRIRG